MSLAPARVPFLLAFLACAVALAGAWALEAWAYLMPCSLCDTQRVVYGALGVVCFTATLLNAKRQVRRLLAGLAMLLAGTGGVIASRQLWLQYHLDPAQALDLINAENRIRTHGGRDAIRLYLLGGPDCGLVNWSLLGLSLPEWSLLGFCAVVVLMVFPLVRR